MVLLGEGRVTVFMVGFRVKSKTQTGMLKRTTIILLLVTFNFVDFYISWKKMISGTIKTKTAIGHAFSWLQFCMLLKVQM